MITDSRCQRWDIAGTRRYNEPRNRQRCPTPKMAERAAEILTTKAALVKIGGSSGEVLSSKLSRQGQCLRKVCQSGWKRWMFDALRKDYDEFTQGDGREGCRTYLETGRLSRWSSGANKLPDGAQFGYSLRQRMLFIHDPSKTFPKDMDLSVSCNS